MLHDVTALKLLKAVKGYHRRLQARAYPSIAPGYFEPYILISRGLDVKTPISHMRAYAHTDVCIAYSVVTKYAFHNCASNAA